MRREEAAAEQELPDMLDPPRILPDEQRFEMFNRPHHRQFPPGDARLADARNPLVGIDHHKQKVTPATPHRVAFDIGDFHENCSSC